MQKLKAYFFSFQNVIIINLFNQALHWSRKKAGHFSAYEKQ